MKRTYIGLLLLFNVFWAASISVYKSLEPLLDSGSMVTLRFGIAALLLLAAAPILPGPVPKGRALLICIGMGVLVFCLGHRLLTAGLRLGSAGTTSLLMGLEPVVTGLAAGLFLREPIRRARWFAFALGTAGLVTLNFDTGVQGTRWAGVIGGLLIFAYFFCESTYSIVGKRLFDHASLYWIMAVSLGAGLAANLALDGATTFGQAMALDGRAWAAVLFLALLCTLAGYMLWYAAIQVIDVSLAALTIFLQPVAGLIIAVLWLGEPVRGQQVLGGALVMWAMIVGFKDELRPSTKPTETH